MQFAAKRQTQARHAGGDGPATQASRLASLSSGHVVFADGYDLVQQSTSTSTDGDQEEEGRVLWTSPHRIQSVTSSSASVSRIAAVDAVGTALVTTTTTSGGTSSVITASSSSGAATTHTGWCGAAFLQDGAQLAVTQMWRRETAVLDLETAAQPLLTLQHTQIPLAVCASPDRPSLLFVCEWDTATVWDVRARIPLVETLAGNQLGGGGSGPLWAIAAGAGAGSSGATTLCVGGEDRVVASLDDRKWRSFDLWRTPLKHDVVALAVSSKQVVVALGLDHEIAQHSLHASASSAPNSGGDASHRLHDNHRVFRTRARWAGMAAAAATSGVLARDAQGTLYRFDLD